MCTHSPAAAVAADSAAAVGRRHGAVPAADRRAAVGRVGAGALVHFSSARPLSSSVSEATALVRPPSPLVRSGAKEVVRAQQQRAWRMLRRESTDWAGALQFRRGEQKWLAGGVVSSLGRGSVARRALSLSLSGESGIGLLRAGALLVHSNVDQKGRRCVARASETARAFLGDEAAAGGGQRAGARAGAAERGSSAIERRRLCFTTPLAGNRGGVRLFAIAPRHLRKGRCGGGGGRVGVARRGERAPRARLSGARRRRHRLLQPDERSCRAGLLLLLLKLLLQLVVL